jgi:hypothetical protein
MRLQELRDAIARSPFRQFRVFLTDGASFEVRHPEMCMAGHGAAIIGLQAPNDPEPVFDRHVVVDLSHIVRIEPSAVPVTGNGAGGTMPGTQ